MDAIALAKYGMMTAARRFEQAAATVGDGGGLDAQGAAELVLSKAQFVAQLATLRVADEMQRALLELQAARA